MDKSQKFWNKIALRYSKRPIADEEAYQKKLQITREYLKPDMQVLELGCGTGSTAIAHADYVAHIRAIDSSEKMIAIAKEKISDGSVKNVSFEQSAIDDLNAPDQSIDLVLGLSILHLLEDKESVIARVHKMLKTEGLFISSTTCLGDTMKFIKLIAPIGKLLGFMPLVKVFTCQELQAALTKGGFEIERLWQPGKGEAVFIVARKNQ